MWLLDRAGHWNTGATTGVVTGILVLQQGWPLEYWCYNRGGHWNTGATTKQGC